MSEGRERGKWIKTIHFDVNITTSQTIVVSAFIDKVITDEQLNPNDIILLKYLQLVDSDNFAIYKIFKCMQMDSLVRTKITQKILIELRSISLRLFREVVTNENLKQMMLRKSHSSKGFK